MVDKKDGSYRVCVDYRHLNRLTKKNAATLPRIEDCYAILKDACFFTTIDLRSGYWQLRVAEKDIPKTAFSTRFGHYEFLVMPFGLCGAPATFQTWMNEVFHDLLDISVIIYLDDILVFSRTLHDHHDHVMEVLQRLNEQKVVINEPKSTFAASKVTFLGHTISAAGIQSNTDTVSKVLSWPRPSTITHVRGFLNLAGYYRRFVKDFARIATPLYQLTQGSPRPNAAIAWNELAEEAFNKMKIALTTPPVLRFPDPARPFIIDCDASAFAIGAVLQQGDHENYQSSNFWPIAFESKKLTETETRYSAQERELLAVKHALCHWRHYVEGSTIIVRTDHESLKYYRSQRDMSRRLARFVSDIEHFNPEILYRSGSLQAAPDALSRRPGLPEETTDLIPTFQTISTRRTNQSPEKLTEIRDLLEKGLTSALTKGFALKDGNLYQVRHGLPDLPVIILPSEVQQLLTSVHHESGHAGVDELYRRILPKALIPNAIDCCKAFVNACAACQHHQRSSEIAQPLQPLPKAAMFERWHMDFLGPLIQTATGQAHILLGVDAATSWIYLQACTGPTEASALKMLELIISNHGVPKTLVTDNGKAFEAERLRAYCDKNGIRQSFTSTYHPQSNGKAERHVRLVKDMLARYCYPNGMDHWDDYLFDVQFALRTRHLSRAGGKTPYYLVYGIEDAPKTPVSLPLKTLASPHVYQTLEERLRKLSELKHDRALAFQRIFDDALRQAARSEECYTERSLAVGDVVLRRKDTRFLKSLTPRWDGPFVISDVYTNNNYQLRARNGHTLVRAINGAKLKRYLTNSETVSGATALGGSGVVHTIKEPASVASTDTSMTVSETTNPVADTERLG